MLGCLPAGAPTSIQKMHPFTYSLCLQIPHSSQLVQSTVYILSWQKSQEMITSIWIRPSLLSNVQNKIPKQKKKFQFPLPLPHSMQTLPLELME